MSPMKDITADSPLKASHAKRRMDMCSAYVPTDRRGCSPTQMPVFPSDAESGAPWPGQRPVGVLQARRDDLGGQLCERVFAHSAGSF